MINNSYSKIKPYLPLDKEMYLGFDLEKIGYIDQYLFRFSKLQDSMGEKLFSTMLFLLAEDFFKKPFIDILNRLEKMELLYKDEWLKLRKIRNNVANEYSFNIVELVDSLNDIYDVTNDILKIYNDIYNYCIEKFDFVKNSEVLEA
jgi:hypothetical protein